MPNPISVDVTVVNGTCTARQRLNQTTPGLYGGATGDYDFAYLYSVGNTWELVTFNGPYPGCDSQRLFERDPAANNPIGSYEEIGGNGVATVVPA